MTLSQRLDKLCQKGALSTADLALWLDLPYCTVRSYRQGTTPNAARTQEIDRRLKALDLAIKSDLRLPVPLSVRKQDRKSYILGVRDGGRHKG